MKKFEVPEMEVVHFGQIDVLTTSCDEDTICRPCDGCPPGSYDCGCYDFNT